MHAIYCRNIPCSMLPLQKDKPLSLSDKRRAHSSSANHVKSGGGTLELAGRGCISRHNRYCPDIQHDGLHAPVRGCWMAARCQLPPACRHTAVRKGQGAADLENYEQMTSSKPHACRPLPPVCRMAVCHKVYSMRRLGLLSRSTVCSPLLLHRHGASGGWRGFVQACLLGSSSHVRGLGGLHPGCTKQALVPQQLMHACIWR